jgi:hypothetical protein
MKNQIKTLIAVGIVLAAAVGIVLSPITYGGRSGTGNTVKVTISSAQIEQISSWPEDIVFFTRASDPITSLEGLKDDEFAMWGMELVPVVQKLLVPSGREDTPVGLRIVGTGSADAKFSKNVKLKLFVTHEALAEEIIEGGGIRIKFVRKQSKR